MAQSTYSLSVGGDGDYVSVPLPAVASGDDFALSFWCYRDGTASGGFQSLFDDDTGSRYWSTFVGSNGATSFTGTIAATVTAWSANEWHHIAIRRTGGNCISYLDGAQVHTAANTSAASALNLDFGFNASGGGSHWLGKYDDIAFWKTTIPSADDIADIADGSVDVSTLSPYGLWRLEEGSGGTVADTSGNSNDGVVSGATWDSDVPTPLQGGGGPATYTGTSSLTTEVFTLSASATFVAPTYTGTSTLTAEVFTLNSSATFVVPTYTGTSTLQTEVFTLASSATFSPGTKTGTSSLTAEVFTLSSSATFTAPTYTGTSSLSTDTFTLSASGTFNESDDRTGTSSLSTEAFTLSATGTFTAPTYTGTSSLATEVFTLAASGIFATVVFSGTSSLTTEAFTLSSSATHTPPTYTGTSSLTTEVFTLATSAQFTPPTYTGSSSLQLDPFTMQGSGQFNLGTRTGTSNLVLDAFTMSAVGDYTPPAIGEGRHVIIKGYDRSKMTVKGYDRSKVTIRSDLR